MAKVFAIAAVGFPAVSAACTVKVSQTISAHPCKEHSSFGCFENSSMWVSNGCRGVFECDGITNVRCDPCDPGTPHCNPFAVCKCVPAPPTPAPPPAPLGAKYLLLDDRNIIDTGTASLALGAVTKNPAGALIKEERDYEMRFDNMQPNVWYDPALGKWRAWYSAFTDCGGKPKTEVPYCNNAPQTCGSTNGGSKASRGSGLLFAESDDGIVWTKPDLNMTDWKGSKANNLIELGGMTTQVYLDERAANSSERYKIVTGSNGAGGIATSPDGIHWSPVKDLEGQTHARWDTPKNLIWDHERQQWIIFVRSSPTASEPEGGGLRIQSYTHSLTADFMGNWAPAAPTGVNSSFHYQPDGLVAFPYEGIFLGIGNVFNPTQEAAPSGAAVGQVNMVLGWSADGRRWKWLLPNESIVPLGNGGDFDACGVFGAKQDPLRTAGNDSLRLYYTGCNGPFFGSRGCALGMATLPRDHFAGYRGGTVTTAPVLISTSQLRVSVAGGNDGVQVGVVGDPTRSVDACDPITGSITDAIVTWKGASDLSHLVHGAYALEFKIPADATAFAYSI